MTDRFIEELLQTVPSEMARLNVPGCAISLIGDGVPTETFCFGEADRETGTDVTPATRFSLQSVSKSITAWAVMQLFEEELLDLDQPINHYLKRWTLPPSPQFDLSLVTPRRLLSHHAGVTIAGFRGVALDQTSFTLIHAMQGKLPSPTIEQQQHYAYWNLPPDDDVVTVTHPPGAEWRYSNAGFGLLELAIEDITGENFGDFVARVILEPLGMNNSCYGRKPGFPYAQPHNRRGEPTQDYRWLCGAAGGVYSTIDDLATFACAGMETRDAKAGRGVLAPASVRVMHTDHGLADKIGALQAKTGLGHILLDLGERLNVHHSGGSIGWRSIYSIFPATGAGICILTNGEAANDLWQPLVFRWNELQLERGDQHTP